MLLNRALVGADDKTVVIICFVMFLLAPFAFLSSAITSVLPGMAYVGLAATIAMLYISGDMGFAIAGKRQPCNKPLYWADILVSLYVLWAVVDLVWQLATINGRSLDNGLGLAANLIGTGLVLVIYSFVGSVVGASSLASDSNEFMIC